MIAAIYSRKSKFTGKGDSIENQIQLCKEYALHHFQLSDKDIMIYEDEGFSGGNIDRPQFQQLLKAARNKKFDILICYRLDRISRNIADFSALIEELQKYNISFVSIREQFDTSTPMGRAMMYIASVFAQLERETIAERIRDNMLQLAKTGRWLGGITPTGFESKAVDLMNPNGKQKKFFKLSPIDEELNIVKLIYDKFLELKSLTKLETYCIQNNIKSRNNIDFSRFSLRNILTNPVYAFADKKMYNYLSINKFEVYAQERDFDGQNGIMAYNKTIQKKNTSNKLRNTSEWIISVGAHVGVIESGKWIKVQNIINRNKSKTFRKVKNSDSLLSGILKCGNCGSFMRPKMGRVNKEGIQVFYYMCEIKEKSKKVKCDIKNVRGNDLDKLIVEELKKLSANHSELHDKISKNEINIKTAQSDINSEIEILENNIKNNELAIANLVSSLSEGKNSSAAKYIISQIDKLDKQTGSLKEKLLDLRERAESNEIKTDSLNIMKDMIIAFATLIDSLDVVDKRNLIRSIVDKITWDGESIDIIMFGESSEKSRKNVSVGRG